MSTQNQNVRPGTQNEVKAVFEITEGAGRKKTLMVRKDRVVIGSVESADVKLGGANVTGPGTLELDFSAQR